MRAISDSSPLIALNYIHRLELLRDLFSQVIVPSAVQSEIKSFRLPEWLQVLEIPPDAMVDVSIEGLGAGEIEAIGLARHLSPDRLLIDDGLGRRLAKQLGLKIVGVIGLLAMAKDKGLIAAVRPEIDSLVAHGFRMSRSLYRHLLVACNEE